jgi:4-hydroxy-4-methyl-2-oxoglutarate aldolase
MSAKVYGKPGFCLVKDIERPAKEDIQKLAEYPVALIGDGYGRRAIMDSAIKPLSPKSKIAGSAVTIETHPADNLMIHAAMAIAEEGDVLVINAHGSLSNGIFGDLLCNIAVRKKLAGIVMDGAVRDKEELIASGMPVFTRGVNPMGGGKEGPGQVNVATSCGGVVVNPGDIVIGDADGIIVIPKEHAQIAAVGAQAKVDAEEKRMEQIKTAPIDKLNASWLIPTLQMAGVLQQGEDL